MNQIDGTIIFEQQPRIVSFASVVGKKEAQGPLRECFDRIIYDSYVGQDTFEKGESELMRTALKLALDKARLKAEDIGIAYCGDLLNQCVASSFAVNGSPVQYAGIYGACSTMALGLILSAIAVEGGAARRAMCAASSHYCTAERQYRFPLEYGSQRPPTAQWTVTGAGACVIEADSLHHQSRKRNESRDITADRIRDHGGAEESSSVARPANDTNPPAGSADERIAPNTDMPYIRAARPGVITDMGVTDQNNMGAAMAPAVVKLGTKKF